MTDAKLQAAVNEAFTTIRQIENKWLEPVEVPQPEPVERRTVGYILVEIPLTAIPQDGDDQADYDARLEQRYLTRAALKEAVVTGNFDIEDVSVDPDSRRVGM